MRILVMIESLGRGGAERALVYLLPRLQARGFCFEVAALWPPYDLAPELETAGIPVHRLDIRFKWNLLAACWKIAFLCRVSRFDILHSHLFFAAFYSALTWPFSPRTVRLVTLHNLGYDVSPAFDLSRKLLKVVDGLFMRTCIDAHIAVSARVAQHYLLNLGLREITVIPNALPVSFSLPSKVDRAKVFARYNLPGGQFLVLMVGRFAKEKGHRYLLEAVEMLRRRNLHLAVLIIGDGPLAEEIANEIRSRKLDDRVKIHPAIPHTELLDVMEAADVLVLPSTHEGFPLAPAEAMLMGKPVLATAVGGLPELIEDGISGLLVPPANPEALCAGIAKLMSAPALRKKLGKAGRLRVTKSFSCEELVPVWQQFYENLFRKRRQ